MHLLSFFFFNDTATTEIYTLSLHDALPISIPSAIVFIFRLRPRRSTVRTSSASSLSRMRSTNDRSILRMSIRSEEHTSELQSRQYLVCRLLLEKKKKQT